jgi:hypothetical protein
MTSSPPPRERQKVGGACQPRTTSCRGFRGVGVHTLAVAALQPQSRRLLTPDFLTLSNRILRAPNSRIVTFDQDIYKIFATLLRSVLYANTPMLTNHDYVVANPPFSDKTWSTGLKTARKTASASRTFREPGRGCPGEERFPSCAK